MAERSIMGPTVGLEAKSWILSSVEKVNRTAAKPVPIMITASTRPMA